VSDEIGHVESRKGHRYAVSFDGWGNVYVKREGSGSWGRTWEKVGKADSAGDAMRRAEAYVYND